MGKIYLGVKQLHAWYKYAFLVMGFISMTYSLYELSIM